LSLLDFPDEPEIHPGLTAKELTFSIKNLNDNHYRHLSLVSALIYVKKLFHQNSLYRKCGSFCTCTRYDKLWLPPTNDESISQHNFCGLAFLGCRRKTQSRSNQQRSLRG
jgi:hypothetical protein